MCRGDNGKRQINYAGILGSFVSGGVSYTYYPCFRSQRVSLVMQNSAVRIAESSLAGIVQEFVVRRFTSVRGGKKASAATLKDSN